MKISKSYKINLLTCKNLQDPALKTTIMQELARSYQDDMREKILGFKFYAKEFSITFIILRKRKNKANYEIKTKILIKIF